jgi:hypothetical protein
LVIAKSSFRIIWIVNDKLSYSLSLFPSRSEEHVGGTEEEADSFSGQLPERIGKIGKSPVSILVEEKDLDSYRRDWESSWGGKFGLFRDYSNLLNHLVLALLIFLLLHAST